MVLILVLGALVVLYIVKLNANAEVIRDNCKTDSDAVNVKNGQKVFSKTRVANILLILCILSLVVCLLFNFTNIGHMVIEYFSYDFYKPKDFNYYFYLVPVYIFIIREIIVQVQIGDFLYKYFNVKEPELEENLLKSILYKKKPEDKPKIDSNTSTDNVNNTNNENKGS